MKRAFFVGVVSLLLLPTEALALQSQVVPHLAYAYPAGCQRGTTVSVVVGGQFLQGTSAVYVSGEGVTATIGEYFRPLTQGQANSLQQKLQEARKKLQDAGVRVGALGGAAGLARVAKEAGVTDEELQLLALYRRDRQDPKKQPNPQVAETVTLQVKVEPGALPGTRELRLANQLGLTNPVRFEVGVLPEVTDVRATDHVAQAVEQQLPLLINGQILPGEVDRYRLHLPKGRVTLIAAKARALTPYIADAVPGWFQATLALFDPRGKEVAFSSSDGTDQDPVLRYRPAEDGDYVLEVRDAIYRGREDFVYRLVVSDPLIIAGSPKTAFDAGPAWNGKAVEEREPNSDLAHTQQVALPAVIAGKIAKSADVDLYRFKAKKGEKVVAEVLARRTGSPLDSYLQLTDAKGRILVGNDDFGDKAAAVVTHQADSYLSAIIPADGDYFLAVKDVQAHGGADFSYRVRIGPPRPDFELRVVPSSVTARAGTNIALTVYAIRRDGFAGDVALGLSGAPEGYRLSGGVIPGSLDRLTVTLTVPGTSVEPGKRMPLALHIEGSALVEGRSVTRPVRASEDMVQAFANHHIVPQGELMVAVIGQPVGIRVGVPQAPVKLSAGGSTEIRITGVGQVVINRVKLVLSEGPDGVTLQEVKVDGADLVVVLRADAQKAKAGLRGNLIFGAFLEPVNRQTAPPGQRPAAQRRAAVGNLPAIPFETVKP